MPRARMILLRSLEALKNYKRKRDIHQLVINKFFRLGKKLGYMPILEFSTWNITQKKNEKRTDLVWFKDKKIIYAFEIESSCNQKNIEKMNVYSKHTKRYVFHYIDSMNLFLINTTDKKPKKLINLLIKQKIFNSVRIWKTKKSIYLTDHEKLKEQHDRLRQIREKRKEFDEVVKLMG